MAVYTINFQWGEEEEESEQFIERRSRRLCVTRYCGCVLSWIESGFFLLLLLAV